MSYTAALHDVITQIPPTPGFSLERVVPLGQASARIFGQAYKNREYSERDYALTLASLFDARARLLPGTLRRHDHDYLSGVVCATARTLDLPSDPRALTQALASANIYRVTANVFRDHEDTIWKLEETTMGPMLKASGEDDFEAILNERVARTITNAAGGSAAVLGAFNTGDYVLRFMPETRRVSGGFGLVVDNGLNTISYIVDRASGDVSVANPACVLDAVTGLDEGYSVTAAPVVNAVDMGPLVAYMRELFGKKSSYFKQLEEKIKKMAAAR